MTRFMPTRITTHPGEILKEDFMVPLGLSARSLAEALDVPPNRLTAIINGRRSVTANTALRLGNFFQTTPEFWLNIQQSYDLSKERVEGGASLNPVNTLRPGENLNPLTLPEALNSIPLERRAAIERRVGRQVRRVTPAPQHLAAQRS